LHIVAQTSSAALASFAFVADIAVYLGDRL
jgi:hypothetical protein